MPEIRRSEHNFGDVAAWHIAVDRVGVYIRAYAADAINISVEDARDIAHAILELTDVKELTDE